MKVARVISLALAASMASYALAAAAGTRTVEIENRSGALIDVGFLQPPSSFTIVKYGTIHDGKNFLFRLDDNETAIVVKSSACHGSVHFTLPNERHVVATVEKDCKVSAP